MSVNRARRACTNRKKTEGIPTCCSIFLTDDLCVVIRGATFLLSDPFLRLWSLVGGSLDCAFWKLELRIHDEIMTVGSGRAQWLDWLFRLRNGGLMMRTRKVTGRGGLRRALPHLAGLVSGTCSVLLAPRDVGEAKAL